MTAQAEGIRLLTEDAAAEHAGVDVETIWAWKAQGFIKPVETPVGARFALHEIRAVLEHGREFVARTEYMKPGQAASRLQVTVTTLTRKASEGRLSVRRNPDGTRRYVATEIRDIAARREEPGFSLWWPEPKTD